MSIDTLITGLINPPEQSAAEIVHEMTEEAVKCLVDSANTLGALEKD